MCWFQRQLLLSTLIFQAVPAHNGSLELFSLSSLEAKLLFVCFFTLILVKVFSKCPRCALNKDLLLFIQHFDITLLFHCVRNSSRRISRCCELVFPDQRDGASRYLLLLLLLPGLELGRTEAPEAQRCTVDGCCSSGTHHGSSLMACRHCCRVT